MYESEYMLEFAHRSAHSVQHITLPVRARTVAQDIRCREFSWTGRSDVKHFGLHGVRPISVIPSVPPPQPGGSDTASASLTLAKEKL